MMPDDDETEVAPTNPQLRGHERELAAAIAFGSWSEAAGQRLPIEILRRWVAQFNWRGTLFRLAGLAQMAYHRETWNKEHGLRAAANGALSDWRGAAFELPEISNYLPLIREYFQRNDRPVAHERGLSMLQGLAILYGADVGDDAPADAFVALWLLAINDYLDDWQADDTPTMSADGRLVADLFVAGRYNGHIDLEHLFARAVMLFRRPDHHGSPLRDESLWAAVGKTAFPTGFYEEFLSAWAPLYYCFALQAPSESGAPRFVDRRKWRDTHPTLMPLVEALTTTRADAQEILKKNFNRFGLPLGTHLHKTPFIRTSPDEHLPLLPQFFANQLYFGLWNRFREACAALRPAHAAIGVETWPSSFGYMFENYCQELARFSVDTEKTTLVLPTPNTDELDDIVLLEGNDAIVISVKAGVILDDIARKQLSRAKTLEWLEDHLLGEKKPKRREGYLRLLDKSVARVEKAYEKSRKIENVYPVLVTADSLGYNGATARWLEYALPQSTNLVRDAVGVLTICDVKDFERFMALVANGVSAFEILRRRSEPQWRRSRLDVLVYDMANERGLSVKHPYLMRKFDEIAEDMMERMRKAATELDAAAEPSA